jgi:hypothetical protein
VNHPPVIWSNPVLTATSGGALQQAMLYRYNDNGIRVASTLDGVETSITYLGIIRMHS